MRAPGRARRQVVNREMDFSDDVKTVAEEKIIVTVDGTAERVLNG